MASKAGAVGKLAKPQLRGLLYDQIKKTLLITGAVVAVEIFYMKFIWGNGRKARYAEFYKNYDINKEFNRMKNKGLFNSVGPEFPDEE